MFFSGFLFNFFSFLKESRREEKYNSNWYNICPSNDRFFEVELPDPNNRNRVCELMVKWYSKHAKQLLEKRLQDWLPQFIRRGAPEPELRFRRMQKRWGSCTKNNVIMLNTELVKAPLQCIDYVIVHELCHLVYPKHDTRFRSLLNRILPDWEKRKARLERVVI